MKKYLLDLSSYRGDDFDRLYKRLLQYCSVNDVPPIGSRKFVVFWDNPLPISEVLGIPESLIRPVP